MHVAWFASRAAVSLMYVWSCLCCTRTLFALCTLSVLMWSSLFSAFLSFCPASVLLFFLSLFLVLLTVCAFFLFSSSSLPRLLCGSCSCLCYPCLFWPFGGSDCRRSLVCCELMLFVGYVPESLGAGCISYVCLSFSSLGLLRMMFCWWFP